MTRIVLQVAGMNGDEPVRFEDFIKQLDRFRHALTETDRIVTGSPTPSVVYHVVDLKRSSPAQVVLEGEAAPRQRTDRSAEVVLSFVKAVHTVQDRGEAPAGFDGAALRAYQQLVALVGTRVAPPVVSADGETVALSQRLGTNVQAILGNRRYSLGTISGRLEKINIHQGQNVFTVYPRTGPAHGIACHFTKRDLSDAVAAVNRYVHVTGRLAYNPIDPYPESVNVRAIQIQEPDGEPVPKVLDLLGIARDATGNDLSEVFVGRLRDEW